MRMMFMVMAVVLLSACGQVDRVAAQLTGYSKVCVDGITYLQFTSGAAVQVDARGMPVQCR